MNLKYRIVGIIVLAAIVVIVLAFLSNGGNSLPQKPIISATIPTTSTKTAINAPPKPIYKEQAKIASKTTKTKKKTTKAQSSKSHKKQNLVKVPKQPQGWAVQLASFTHKDNAQKLVKKLRTRGYAAYIREAKTGKNTIIRVMVGPELQRSKANKLKQALHSMFKLQGIVVKYNV